MNKRNPFCCFQSCLDNILTPHPLHSKPSPSEFCRIQPELMRSKQKPTAAHMEFQSSWGRMRIGVNHPAANVLQSGTLGFQISVAPCFSTQTPQLIFQKVICGGKKFPDNLTCFLKPTPGSVFSSKHPPTIHTQLWNRDKSPFMSINLQTVDDQTAHPSPGGWTGWHGLWVIRAGFKEATGGGGWNAGVR